MPTDNREVEPSLEWHVLRLFAQHGGFIKSDRNQLTEMVIKSLCDVLKNYFGIHDQEPFIYDEKAGGYRSVIKLEVGGRP